VAENRKLSVLLVDKLADGRIYTANQAKDLKLIDAVADEEFAQKYLKEKLKDENISIVDYELEPEKSWLEKAIPQEKIQGKIFSSLLNTLFSAHKLLMF
jgi:protease-4